VIGTRAQRLYEEKREKGEIPVKPMPEEINCDIDRPASIERPQPKPSELLIGTIALLPTAALLAKKIRDELKTREDEKVRDELKKSA